LLVSELITRTLAEWLYPGGDEIPQYDFLTTAVDADDLEVVLEGRVESVPKDSILQVGDELMLVKEVTGTAVTLAPEGRGYRDSTAAAHDVGALVEVDPTFSRLEIYHALREIMGRLGAWGLYKRTVDASLVCDLTEVIETSAGTLEVLSILVRDSGEKENYLPLTRKGKDWIEFKEFDPVKILMKRGYQDQPMRVVCRQTIGLPTSMSFDLDDELSETFQEGLPMAVAGQVLKGREVPRAYADRIREVLAQEGMPPGAIIDVGEALLSLFRRDAVMAERRRLDELDEPTFEWAWR
jgi:hypothetical protein